MLQLFVSELEESSSESEDSLFVSELSFEAGEVKFNQFQHADTTTRAVSAHYLVWPYAL